MWFLNFCSPYDQLYELNRRVMAFNLILLLVMYLYLRLNLLLSARIEALHKQG